jgi:phosphonate transport system substrate-binding protein
LGLLLLGHALVFHTAIAFEHPKNEARTYSFGIVPQFEQRKLFRIWQPIIDEIERQTGLRLKIKGSAKIPNFEASFLAGEFDFAYMNPYHIVIANKSQGYIPLIRDGRHSLQGIVVVRKDSDIAQVSQLHAKKIAFPSPNALGASLIIRADLSDVFNIEFVPTYVQTHSSVYLHVAKGLADAGGGVIRTFNSQISNIQQRLRIVYKTREIPPHPVAAHPRVPREDRQLVLHALIALARTPQGKRLLARIPINDVVATSINDYNVIRDWKLDKYYVAN